MWHTGNVSSRAANDNVGAANLMVYVMNSKEPRELELTFCNSSCVSLNYLVTTLEHNEKDINYNVKEKKKR